MKTVLLVFVLFIAGCLSFGPPHGVWSEPAVQVQGRLAGSASPGDSVFVMRTPHFGAHYDDRSVLQQRVRRYVARLEGDTTDTGLRPESFPKRAARVSEDGTFSVAFPPAEYYGGLPPTGGWYWSDEAILIRVAGSSDQTFAIELAPPRRTFVFDRTSQDFRPAESDEVRVEAVEEDGVLPDSTANLILKVETQ